jgi:very-short-patch-repair endonuclease
MTNFLPYNKELLLLISQSLRKTMTDAERRLWSRIRLKQLGGFTFYRQKTIGNYIVDFWCPKAKLIIEVDGSQHYAQEGIESDKIRDDYLRKLGYKVLRFSDSEVLTHNEGVVEAIYREVVR